MSVYTWMLAIFIFQAECSWATFPWKKSRNEAPASSPKSKSEFYVPMGDTDSGIDDANDFKLTDSLDNTENPVSLENSNVVSLEGQRTNVKIVSRKAGKDVLKITYLKSMGSGTIVDLLGEITSFGKRDTPMYFYFDDKNTIQVELKSSTLSKKLQMIVKTIESPVVKGVGNPNLLLVPEAKKANTYKVCEKTAPKKAIATVEWRPSTDEVTIKRKSYNCHQATFSEGLETVDTFKNGNSPFQAHFNSEYNFELNPQSKQLVVNLQNKKVFRDNNEFGVEIYYRDQLQIAAPPNGFPYIVTRRPSNAEPISCLFGINPNPNNKTFNVIVLKDSRFVNETTVYVDDKQPQKPLVAYHAEMTTGRVRVSVAPRKPTAVAPPKPMRSPVLG